MGQFFVEEREGQEELYRQYRDDPFTLGEESAREFLERAWRRCHEFLDPDFPQEAQRDFLARFWELYVAYTLDLYGLPLAKGRKADGPDFLVLEPRLWVEAVRVSRGLGGNEVPQGPEGIVRPVPDVALKLRLRSGIEDKARKFQTYRQTGVIPKDEPTLIALSAAGIPNSRLEREIPRVVRAVLPFGHTCVSVDVETLEIESQGHHFRDREEKPSGAEVRTDVFVDPKYRHISGLIYCASDPINRPPVPGDDFVTVHNPCADVPIERGVFRFGREYWVEGGELLWNDHTERADVG